MRTEFGRIGEASPGAAYRSQVTDASMRMCRSMIEVFSVFQAEIKSGILAGW